MVKGGKASGEASNVDQKISECVDAALKKLGKNAGESIYYYLEKDFNLKKFEMSKKPEIFEKALTKIFGEQGAKTIEKLIIIEIRNTFQLKRSFAFTFKEAVKVIKNSSIRIRNKH